MECSRCHAANPDVARFCFRCGAPLRGAEPVRGGRTFAVQSTENVTQLAVISTVMPHANRRSADAYRWGLLAAAGVVLVLTILGYLSFAIIAAAVTVPVAYLVYLYDANPWEDAPISVVVGMFLATAVLAALVSLVFFEWAFADAFARLSSGPGARAGIGSISIGSLLVFAVLLPVVALVVMNVGPIVFARKAMFDDMIDGLTLGVAAGTAYAMAETIVAFWPVVSSGGRVTQGIASWVVVVLNLMIVKSLIYGTSAGIAIAAFSGRGEGYDGFTPAYTSNLVFVAVLDVAYWLGVHLLSYVQFGQALGLLWGVAILAVLVIRVRIFLHTALLEAAVEGAAAGARAKAAVTEAGFCPECELPLLPDAMFCIVCGQSVRAASGAARRGIRESGRAS
jgi:zinc-ribbon domain